MPTTDESRIAFQGFRREAIDFLAELAANNDRAWFQPRKADYERLLKRPLEALCAGLAERFAARGIPLVSDPVRSPFRIYRDVRFSRDKAPYKTHVSASFPWAGEAAATPTPDRGGGGARLGTTGGPLERHVGGGGYFHLGPGEVFVGGGMWHPDPGTIAAWRSRVVGDPAVVHDALGDPAFVHAFSGLSGERLTRVPRGYQADHPDADLLRLKDLTFGRRLSDADAQSANLPDVIADSLAAALPVFRLLAGLTVP